MKYNLKRQADRAKLIRDLEAEAGKHGFRRDTELDVAEKFPTVRFKHSCGAGFSFWVRPAISCNLFNFWSDSRDFGGYEPAPGWSVNEYHFRKATLALCLEKSWSDGRVPESLEMLGEFLAGIADGSLIRQGERRAAL